MHAVDGIAFHSYNEGVESGGVAARDARDEILKFRNELKLGAEIWMTENCTIISENFTDSAIRHLRSMMRDIGYLQPNYYLYWLGSSDKEKFAGEELITRGQKTKLYFVFQKLWHTVASDQFCVKTFEPATNQAFTAYGPDPMDMLTFLGKRTSVILLTNPGSDEKKITLKGIPGTKMSIHRTSWTEDMAAIGTSGIAAEETVILLQGRSILLLQTNCGV